MTLPQPKAVFFDLGETLVTQNIEDNMVTRQALKRVSEELQTGSSDLYRLYKIGYGHNQPIRSRHNIEIPISTWMRELLRNALDKEPTIEQVNRAERIVVESRAANSVPYPDAKTTLDVLKAEAKIGIISNVSSHDVASRILEKVGLDKCVDTLVTSASTGVRKPDPGIFLYALAKLGATAEKTIHVGDNLRNDIGGASVVGISTVLIERKEKPVKKTQLAPDFIVHALDEIPGLLGEH